MQPDQQREHGNAEQVRGHVRPGVGDLLRQRLVPDVAERQQISASRIGHPALQVANEIRFRHRHRAEELRGGKKRAEAEKGQHAGGGVGPAHADGQIMPDDHDHGDGRDIHQQMDVVDQDEDDRT